jgi:hypothetical protein
MRGSELIGRSGKQGDGSAKTREVKLVIVWSAESQDEKGIPVRDPGSVSYSAAIESAATLDTAADYAEFTQRVLRAATRRGFEQTPRKVVLGDGAVYIWHIAEELSPRSFSCIACGLKLQSYAALHVVGLGGQYTRTTERTPGEYYGLIDPNSVDWMQEYLEPFLEDMADGYDNE